MTNPSQLLLMVKNGMDHFVSTMFPTEQALPNQLYVKLIAGLSVLPPPSLKDIDDHVKHKDFGIYSVLV